MLRAVRTANRSLTEEELSAFFQKVPLEIPHTYLEFLRQHNGGRPVPNVFPIEGLPLNPDGAIQVFFGIGASIPAVDLKNVLTDLPETVPIEVFPIACTDGGDYICFDLRKAGSPVVYWDRREFWGNEVWKERYLFPIAPNFEAFLASLHDAS
jgi:hypothetical protein